MSTSPPPIDTSISTQQHVSLILTHMAEIMTPVWTALYYYGAYISIATGVGFLIIGYYLFILCSLSGDPVKLHRKLKSLPFGRWVFTQGISLFAPYTGSIRPIVENLDYTGATVRITQRRAIENPFNSIHLAALVNFGELAAALPFLTAATKMKKRAIPVAVNTDFVKKATGTIWAKSENIMLVVDDTPKQVATAQITNSNGELCATVRITFVVADQPTKKNKKI